MNARCNDQAVDLRPPAGVARPRPFSSLTVENWGWDTPPDRNFVLMDLQTVSFIDTMGLAIIAAVAEDAEQHGHPVEFVAPTSLDVCRYMSRMHLAECLAQYGCDAQLPAVNERDTGRLSELQRFDADSSDPLADRVIQAHIENGGAREDAKSLYKGVSEVMSNVIDHSGAGGGWAAMQVLPDAGSDKIAFAVADAGAGLHETLSKQYAINGPTDAMEKAFERDYSGTGLYGRGTGLHDLRLRIGRHRGMLRAWSTGSIGRTTGNPIACRPVDTAFPGTVIYAGFKPGSREVSK